MDTHASGSATSFMTKIGAMVQQDAILPHDNSVLQMLAITDYWVYYVF